MIYEDNLMAKTTTTIQHEDTNDVDVRINKRKRIIKERNIIRNNTLSLRAFS